MALIFRNRVSYVWVLLVLATLVSFESVILGHGTAARLIVLLITFTKVTLVGREFMELRHAPPVMQWLFHGWALVVCAILMVLFW